MPDYTRSTDNTPLGGINYLIDENDNTISRAMTGNNGAAISEDRSLRVSSTQFGEIGVSERTPLIELGSIYGLSRLRNVWTETANATITTAETSEFKLSTGNEALDFVELNSAKLGRYIPGHSSEIGIGVRIEPGSVFQIGQFARWGGISANGNDGIFFGVDSVGKFVEILRNGASNKVYQPDWNIDKLDGTGTSEFDLDTQSGNIYTVKYTWYGYGEIRFGVIGQNRYGYQTFLPIHTFSNFSSTSVENPNLRIHASVDNGGVTANNIDIYIGGRQYSVLGKYIPKYRFVDDFAVAVPVNTVRKPLISFRKKVGFRDRTIRLEDFQVITLTEPMLIEIWVFPVLTTPTYGTPDSYDPSETALESDKTAAAVTDGLLIYRSLVDAGKANEGQFLGSSELDFDLPDDSVVTLSARTLTGTGTITALLRIKEEW